MKFILLLKLEFLLMLSLIDMITIPKKEVQVVEHFAPDGTSLGFLNYFDHCALRLEIVKQDAEGYYLIFNDDIIFFDTNGHLDKYPTGLFDEIMLMTREIIRLRIEKHKKSLPYQEPIRKRKSRKKSK